MDDQEVDRLVQERIARTGETYSEAFHAVRREWEQNEINLFRQDVESAFDDYRQEQLDGRRSEWTVHEADPEPLRVDLGVIGELTDEEIIAFIRMRAGEAWREDDEPPAGS